MSESPKFVYIVGAGASKEAQLPLGAELKGEIARLLDIRFADGYHLSSGDELIAAAVRGHLKSLDPPERDINPHLHACWHIRDAMPQAISIDNFIDSQFGDARIELCGKLGIARAILRAERQSLMAFDPSQPDRAPNLMRLEQTWFNKLFQLITENCRKADLEERLRQIALGLLGICVPPTQYGLAVAVGTSVRRASIRSPAIWHRARNFTKRPPHRHQRAGG
jgi:hypothetical protein